MIRISLFYPHWILLIHLKKKKRRERNKKEIKDILIPIQRKPKGSQMKPSTICSFLLFSIEKRELLNSPFWMKDAQVGGEIHTKTQCTLCISNDDQVRVRAGWKKRHRFLFSRLQSSSAGRCCCGSFPQPLVFFPFRFFSQNEIYRRRVIYLPTSLTGGTRTFWFLAPISKWRRTLPDCAEDNLLRGVAIADF